MAITRNELIHYFVRKDDPMSKYWDVLLKYVALHSAESQPVIQALGTTASPTFVTVNATTVAATTGNITTVNATSVVGTTVQGTRFTTGASTTAVTPSGTNYNIHKIYGKIAAWGSTTTIQCAEVVAWSNTAVGTGCELRGMEIKASVDPSVTPGNSAGIATALYTKITNKGTPTLTTARGIHVYIENDTTGIITTNSVFYIEYGATGTFTNSFLFDFKAIGAPGACTTPSTPTPSTPNAKIACRFGSTTFYLVGYVTA